MSATKRWLEELMEQGHDVPVSVGAYAAAEGEDTSAETDQTDDEREHVVDDDDSIDGADPDDVIDLVCADADTGHW